MKTTYKTALSLVDLRSRTEQLRRRIKAGGLPRAYRGMFAFIVPLTALIVVVPFALNGISQGAGGEDFWTVIAALIIDILPICAGVVGFVSVILYFSLRIARRANKTAALNALDLLHTSPPLLIFDDPECGIVFFNHSGYFVEQMLCFRAYRGSYFRVLDIQWNPNSEKLVMTFVQGKPVHQTLVKNIEFMPPKELMSDAEVVLSEIRRSAEHIQLARSA